MDRNTESELNQLILRRQSDVQRMWHLLMAPLGFGSTTLWVTFVDRQGVPLRHLMEITEADEPITPEHVRNLFWVLGEIPLVQDGASVAFLLSRPGRDGLRPSDRELARLLIDGARDSEVTCHPIHVANDVTITPVAPDDLAA